MQENLCREAKELLQCVMESYVSGDEQKLASVFKFLSPDIVVIGTGKHEFYTNKASLLEGLEKDQEEARSIGISFVIRDEWFEAKQISEDYCIVYGEFRACEADTEGKQVVVDMDTRITAGVHRENDGLVIDSLHHSVPYLYQNDGEYYPKTFVNQAEEALKRSAILEEKIQLDSMTGLYNRIYTEKHISRLLVDDKVGGTLFVIDLDNFKRVNDHFGHLKGDEILKKAARVLADAVRKSDIAGRIGGDEFMVFLPEIQSRTIGEKRADEIIEGISHVFGELNLEQGCSIGIAIARAGQAVTFEEIYRKADKALYEAKQKGKRIFCWYAEP